MKSAIKWLLVSVIVPFALSNSAWSDVMGHYRMLKGTTSITLYYRNDDHVRMDLLDNNKVVSSILKIKNKVYLVTPEMIVDAKKMSRLGMKFAKNKSRKNKNVNAKDIKIEATGKYRTIAGIRGEIFKIEIKKKAFYPVLSKDKRLLVLQRGWMKVVNEMMQMKTSAVYRKVEGFTTAKNYGLLGDGQNFELQKIAKKSFKNSLYELPKGRKSMPDLSTLFKGLGR